MSPLPDLRKAKTAQVTLYKICTGERGPRLDKKGLIQKIPQTLAGARDLFGSLNIRNTKSPGKNTGQKETMLAVSATSGVSCRDTQAVTCPEGLILLGQIGRSHELVTICTQQKGIHIQAYTEDTLWVEDELIASCHGGEFLLEETKTMGRNLIVASLPTNVNIHREPVMFAEKGHYEVVGFWLETDPEDLILPRNSSQWEMTKIGGIDFFIFPERRFRVNPNCRAISMRRLNQQFGFYKHFLAAVQSKKTLWKAVQEGFARENIAMA